MVREEDGEIGGGVIKNLRWFVVMGGGGGGGGVSGGAI